MLRTTILAAGCAALLFAGAALFATPALADTVTFVGGYGSPVGATTEGIWTYDTFSGALFRDSGGNGDAFDMEGASSGGGGVMTLGRTDGGLFTFDGSDVKFQFDQSYGITFRGYLGGALQGTDIFVTSNDSTWLTYGSLALAGVFIDELRVVLDATFTTATNIDNVRVTAAVPEPTSIALLGLGLAGIVIQRRRKAKAS